MKVIDNSLIKIHEDKITWQEIIATILLALFVVSVLNIFVMFAVVSGSSMYPTLKNGERLVFSKIPTYKDDYNYDDIVVFEYSKNELFVKRIIGLPNDTIELKDGKIYRNNIELDEKYLYEDYTIGEFKVTVPEDHIFAMGDNRQNSTDSRDIGCIPYNKIMGIKDWNN